jgi:hypothetical protein
MANLTVSEWHVSIRHKHAIGPALSEAEVHEAIRGALISKLGWSNVLEAEGHGDLTVVVS